MVEELKDVLDIFQNNRAKLDIRKTPETYIKPSSTPKEVQEWLKSKEFDIVYVPRLHILNLINECKLQRPKAFERHDRS